MKEPGLVARFRVAWDFEFLSRPARDTRIHPRLKVLAVGDNVPCGDKIYFVFAFQRIGIIFRQKAVEEPRTRRLPLLAWWCAGHNDGRNISDGDDAIKKGCR